MRTIASIGIIMMHVRANCPHEIPGFIYNKMIPSFTDFVFLFMVISAFGMCCGYYERMLSGKINFTSFYKKRYVKILPFFSVLVVLDVMAGFSKASVYEAAADISLMFGLFPNSIGVIGVGWFLGLVFAFYLIFPFFCVLIENKKRAWISLAAALGLNYLCRVYFEVGRVNIVYSLCFFIAGGLIYLYRDKIEELNCFITIPMMVLCMSIYYLAGGNTITQILAYASIVIFAVGAPGGGVLQTKFTSFISSISMEIYLSHMLVFRIIERLHFNMPLENDILQYVMTVILVIIGAILFSVIVKRILDYAVQRLFSSKTIF